MKDAIRTTSKRAVQKTADATVDLIGKKTADKIMSFQKNLLKNYKMTKQKQTKLV